MTVSSGATWLPIFLEKEKSGRPCLRSTSCGQSRTFMANSITPLAFLNFLLRIAGSAAARKCSTPSHLPPAADPVSATARSAASAGAAGAAAQRATARQPSEKQPRARRRWGRGGTWLRTCSLCCGRSCRRTARAGTFLFWGGRSWGGQAGRVAKLWYAPRCALRSLAGDPLGVAAHLVARETPIAAVTSAAEMPSARYRSSCATACCL